jgi:hypothetical protein
LAFGREKENYALMNKETVKTWHRTMQVYSAQSRNGKAPM